MEQSVARYKQEEREQALSVIRQQFITAAIGEIAQVGYADANINHVSQKAGYAKGTIYNYFPSKEALMREIIDRLGAEHLAFIAEQVRQVTHPKERLERFFEAGFDFVASFPAEARLLVNTLYGPNAEFREPLGQAYQPMFGLVAQEILAPGVEGGVFRPIDTDQAAALIMTLYLGTCSQVDQSGRPLLDSRLVAEFAFNALRVGA
jgi:AcrR family transcriptional regulator